MMRNFPFPITHPKPLLPVINNPATRIFLQAKKQDKDKVESPQPLLREMTTNEREYPKYQYRYNVRFKQSSTDEIIK